MTPPPMRWLRALSHRRVHPRRARASAWLRTPPSRRLLAAARRRRAFRGTAGVRRQQDGARIRRDGAGGGGGVRAVRRWRSRAAPSIAAVCGRSTSPGYAALGAWAGLGFMLGELPNSFVKRQLDVAPGMAPRGRAGAAVVVRRRSGRLDHRDVGRDLARRADAVDDVGVRAAHRAGDSSGVQRADVPARREGEAGMSRRLAQPADASCARAHVLRSARRGERRESRRRKGERARRD